MYRVIKSATESSFPSLEEYVGLPLDLSNNQVQYKIAEWAANKMVATLKNTRGLKRRHFEFDDLSWSPTKIYFEILEPKGDEDSRFWPAWSFNGRLRFYDGDPDDYSDIEYLLNDTIDNLVYSIKHVW